jgi:hypothetical protein
MEIHYRKGSLNEADALSRRPELHHTIAPPNKDLEDMHEFLSSMSRLQVNDAIIHKVQYGYALDTTFCKTSLPNGVRFDTSDLYWMADKICLPNDISLRNFILTEYHNNAGHPDPNRTLLNVSKMFW